MSPCVPSARSDHSSCPIPRIEVTRLLATRLMAADDPFLFLSNKRMTLEVTPQRGQATYKAAASCLERGLEGSVSGDCKGCAVGSESNKAYRCSSPLDRYLIFCFGCSPSAPPAYCLQRHGCPHRCTTSFLVTPHLVRHQCDPDLNPSRVGTWSSS